MSDEMTSDERSTVDWILSFLKYYERRYRVPEEKSLLKRLLAKDEE